MGENPSSSTPLDLITVPVIFSCGFLKRQQMKQKREKASRERNDRFFECLLMVNKIQEMNTVTAPREGCCPG